jgi:PhnB protein
MNNSVKAIPAGMNGIIPHLTIRNAAQAIEFYKKAFGATELGRMPMPDGRLMHAMMNVGGTMLFLNDEFPEFGGKGAQTLGGSPVALHVYVEDTDATFNQAVAAGATVKMPPMNMFWGDRYAKLTDPFGHEWSIATHIEDVTPQQMEQRVKEAMTQNCA